MSERTTDRPAEPSTIRSTQRIGAVIALLGGAAGIAIMWASGVEFPVAVPPGIVILVVGAVVVATVRRRWATLVAVVLGLFVLLGFLVSPDGIDHLTGEDGAAVAIGQAGQGLGVTAAAVFGALAYRAER